MRTSAIERNTLETQIALTLNLDGAGSADVKTGCGFLDHMLTLFARHGDFDLTVKCRGTRRWITTTPWRTSASPWARPLRSAWGTSGASHATASSCCPWTRRWCCAPATSPGGTIWAGRWSWPASKVGTFDTELAKEFWLAFVRNCPASIHIRQMAGENTHHILEAVFKGMGRTLKQAVSMDAKHLNDIPSTKGTL